MLFTDPEPVRGFAVALPAAAARWQPPAASVAIPLREGDVPSQVATTRTKGHEEGISLRQQRQLQRAVAAAGGGGQAELPRAQLLQDGRPQVVILDHQHARVGRIGASFPHCAALARRWWEEVCLLRDALRLAEACTPERSSEVTYKPTLTKWRASFYPPH